MPPVFSQHCDFRCRTQQQQHWHVHEHFHTTSPKEKNVQVDQVASPESVSEELKPLHPQLLNLLNSHQRNNNSTVSPNSNALRPSTIALPPIRKLGASLIDAA